MVASEGQEWTMTAMLGLWNAGNTRNVNVIAFWTQGQMHAEKPVCTCCEIAYATRARGEELLCERCCDLHDGPNSSIPFHSGPLVEARSRLNYWGMNPGRGVK